MQEKKQNIFRKTMWFDKRLKFDIDFFDELQAQRRVSKKAKYKSGVFYSDKSKREIHYESGLELAFIKQLEENKNVLFYFEQPIRIPYRKGRKMDIYTPDFGVYLKSKEFVIVEIKDLPSMLQNRVQMKTEALMDFCSKRGFGLLLTNGKDTFEKLMKGRLNRKLERAILKAMESGLVLRRYQINEILKRCEAKQSDIYKIAIKHNMKYRPYPFKLEHNNKNLTFRQVFINKKRYDELMRENFTVHFNE